MKNQAAGADIKALMEEIELVKQKLGEQYQEHAFGAKAKEPLKMSFSVPN